MSTFVFSLLLLVLLYCCEGLVPRSNVWDIINTEEVGLRFSQLRASGDCTSYNCATTGQSCESTANNDIICTDDLTNCNTTSTICTKVNILKLGEACDPDSTQNICDINQGCYNGVCNSRYPAGTPCTKDYNCLFYVNNTYSITSCINKQCYGVGVGQSCIQNSQCTFPLTCGPDFTCITPSSIAGSPCMQAEDCVQSLLCQNTGQCTQSLNLGDACDLENDLCDGPYICTPTSDSGNSGTCKEYYSGSVGSFCTQSPQCGEGQVCNATTSQCIDFPNASNKPCTNNTECADYESCVCDGSGNKLCQYTQVPNSQGAQKATEDYYKCLTKCLRSDNACIAKNCKKQTCAYANYKVQYIVSTYTSRNYPSCVIDFVKKYYPEQYKTVYYIPGYFTCGAASFASNVIVTFGLALVLLL